MAGKQWLGNSVTTSVRAAEGRQPHLHKLLCKCFYVHVHKDILNAKATEITRFLDYFWFRPGSKQMVVRVVCKLHILKRSCSTLVFQTQFHVSLDCTRNKPDGTQATVSHVILDVLESSQICLCCLFFLVWLCCSRLCEQKYQKFFYQLDELCNPMVNCTYFGICRVIQER